MNAVAPLPAVPTSEVDEPDISDIEIEDDTPVDGIVTEKQERVLTESLYSSWSGPGLDEDGVARPFAAFANVGLFTKVIEPPVVPDVMLSLDVTIPEDQTLKKNRTYFMWEYGKAPDVVIEIVSNKKGGEMERRFRRYQRTRVSYYVVYDPLKILSEVTLQAFELRGSMYVVLDRPWFELVGLGIVEWEGMVEGMRGQWLRWCTRDGELIPTGAEGREREKARADAAEGRIKDEKGRADAAEGRIKDEKGCADAAEARAQRLAARLRELGVDPNGDT